MRDLSARLREIVRRDVQPAAIGAVPDAGLRELTYVPDVDVEPAAQDVGACLGGSALDDKGACLVIDRAYAADRSHGRRAIDACQPNRHAPLHLFDERAAAVPEWWRRVVFFDIETTGLSGGAGTVAFLAGCAWFEDTGAFTVRQFFLTGPSGERAMLDALARVFDEASLVVTYNGRTFDVPFMETRWAFHRRSAPTDDLPHFDMLPPARRLWGRRELASADGEGCGLAALERRVLGFHRYADVPGFEIPARYFQFLRTGSAPVIEGVLEHNRHDLVSLAAIMSHALWLVDAGPEACREPSELLALGRLYERAGRADDAMRSFELAERLGEPDVKRHALSRLAMMHRRASRHADAARAWQRILELMPRGRRTLTAIERQAVEALAIHHEHRARDLERARTYAETLGAAVSGRCKHETDRRLQRLARKMAKDTTRSLAYDYDE